MSFIYTKLKIIRDILFQTIQQPAAVNSYYHPQQIVEICNITIGLNNGDDGIDKNIIGRVLSNTDKDSITQKLRSDSNLFIHVFVGKRSEKDGTRFTTTEVFDSEISRVEAERRLIADENRHSICQ